MRLSHKDEGRGNSCIPADPTAGDRKCSRSTLHRVPHGPHSAKPTELGGHGKEPHLCRLPSSTEGMTPRYCYRSPGHRGPDPRPQQSSWREMPTLSLQSPVPPPRPPPRLAPLAQPLLKHTRCRLLPPHPHLEGPREGWASPRLDPLESPTSLRASRLWPEGPAAQIKTGHLMRRLCVSLCCYCAENLPHCPGLWAEKAAQPEPPGSC